MKICTIDYRLYNLGNKSYSRRLGTYNAMWLNEQGEAAFWGSYNPDDGSYFLAVPGGLLATGMWIEQWDGDYEYEVIGTYSFDDVRRVLQFGIL